MAGPLEGRVAIVTGGGGGLAEGICARLARDGAAIFRLAEGKITDAWVVGDTQELWKQLGRL